MNIFKLEDSVSPVGSKDIGTVIKFHQDNILIKYPDNSQKWHRRSDLLPVEEIEIIDGGTRMLANKIVYEKEIASTLMDAMKMHGESYYDYKYARSMEDCLIEAGKKHDLSVNMWALLNLAMHWANDVQSWCEDVLAGKDILSELTMAAMIDEEERSTNET